MPRFRYQRGEKPLEGFTIEHGLGVGGFGEVYYAVSDSGREVALKAVQNYAEIELRGISQCMNLKSPHLVTVFDVKHNEQGQPFVIMEYVRGPSLRQLLDYAPAGLGPTKAAFFLREIAKGLTYLHDAGVVHRDLKPHNVFYEEGYVKIGDYSLCKMMSTSHRSGHTMTVGTVHYMAPEISEGRYDASVDIYALGIMLYEMLTGAPPFVGDSIGEVLMKHLTAQPDLSPVNEPFRSAIGKAIAKDPQKRFLCAAELVEAVFGVEHVQHSVVEFNPQELTMVAHHAAKSVLATPSGRPAASRADDPGAMPWQPTGSDSDRQIYIAEPAHPVSRGDTNKSSADYTAPLPPPPLPASDPACPSALGTAPTLAPDVIHPAIRMALAIGSCVILSAVAKLMYPNGSTGAFVALNIVLTAVAISVTRRLALRNVPVESKWIGRIAIAFGLIATTSLVMLRLPGFGVPLAALPFVILNWHQFIHPRRQHRLVLWPVLASAVMAFFIGLVLSNWVNLAMLFRFGADFNAPMMFAAVTAGVGLWLQIASPKQLPMTVSPTPGEVTVDYRQQPKPVGRTALSPSSMESPVATYQSPSATAPTPFSAAVAMQSMLVAPGMLLYAISLILAVLEIFSSREAAAGGDFLGYETVRILAMVGFGLLVGSIGFMIASGTRRQWAFLRLIAGVGTLAAVHYSCFISEPGTSPMYLLVSMALFAWPARSQYPTGQARS